MAIVANIKDNLVLKAEKKGFLCIQDAEINKQIQEDIENFFRQERDR